MTDQQILIAILEEQRAQSKYLRHIRSNTTIIGVMAMIIFLPGFLFVLGALFMH